MPLVSCRVLCVLSISLTAEGENLAKVLTLLFLPSSTDLCLVKKSDELLWLTLLAGGCAPYSSGICLQGWHGTKEAGTMKMERPEHGVRCGMGWVHGLGRQVLNMWAVDSVGTAP